MGAVPACRPFPWRGHAPCPRVSSPPSSTPTAPFRKSTQEIAANLAIAATCAIAATYAIASTYEITATFSRARQVGALHLLLMEEGLSPRGTVPLGKSPSTGGTLEVRVPPGGRTLTSHLSPSESGPLMAANFGPLRAVHLSRHKLPTLTSHRLGLIGIS